MIAASGPQMLTGLVERVNGDRRMPFSSVNNQPDGDRKGGGATAAANASGGAAGESRADAEAEDIIFVEHVVPDDTPSHRLKKAFDASMINADVPLLSSWDSYKESMPVRHSSRAKKYLKLCDLPFYARETHLEKNAELLETDIIPKTTNDPRFAVAYVSAKTESGKTASILPIFLNSYESNRESHFTHYLYVAFKNNGVNNFGTSEDASTDEKIAERQGAAFMYVCIQALLDCKYKKPSMLDVIVENGPHRNIFQAAVSHLRQVFTVYTRHILRLPQSIPDVGDATERINQLLNDKIPGKHQRILIHLDEHRKMNNSADFCRGAMIALAKCPRVKCVATFTEPLTELLAHDKSSGVSRQPCTHITFDLCVYLDKRYSVDIRRLVAWQNLELTSIQKRKWATLAFRMAAAAHRDSPSSLVFPNLQCDWLADVQSALNRFDAATVGMETLDSRGVAAFNKALGDCLDATALDLPGALNQNQIALDLMNGISESGFTAHFGNNGAGCSLTILNGNVVASWQDLLTLEYDDLVAFGDASQSFRDSLTEPDYLSGIPLEEAYGWSLLSRSADDGTLGFGSDAFSFNFKAINYTTGRLFRTDTANDLCQMVDPTKLKNGVLYRAAEGGNGVDFLQELPTVNDVQVDDQGVTAAPTATALQTDQPQVTHPLCDLFFKSDDDELVMIDITGGNDLTEEKAKKLDEWIGKYGGELKKGTGLLRIVGIVLAPFDKVATVTETSGEASATQPGIELPAGDLSDEEETRDVSAIEEGDSEQPSANEGGAEESVEEAQGDRNDGAGSATIYGKGGREQVLMVTGSNAIDMLGALGQFAEWFDTDSLGESEIPAAEPPATIDEEGQAAQPADQSGASSEAGLE